MKQSCGKKFDVIYLFACKCDKVSSILLFSSLLFFVFFDEQKCKSKSVSPGVDLHAQCLLYYRK